MFRQAALGGFSQDRIHSETHLPTTSLSDWATGKAKLSLLGLLRIAAIENFPTELLSLIFDGTGRHIEDDTADEGDHDRVAGGCIDFLAHKTAAHHPESEAGVAIGPSEDRRLREVSRGLRAA